MTTVLVLEHPKQTRMRVEGILRWAVLVCLVVGRPAGGQDRPVHWLNAGAMPPGAIGSLRLHRGGPLNGYFQPVRVRAPQGARIALAMEGSFTEAEGELLAGMHIGPVYRLKLTEIPNHPGLEIFPTVEVIDRLYPPPGLALRFPIPIELTAEELDLAARGSFVTRVIYVEDPQTALPVARPKDGDQPWVEAPKGADPLVEADKRGRAVAILRIGSRMPNANAEAEFASCAPPAVMYDPDAVCPDQPEGDEVPPEGVYTVSPPELVPPRVISESDETVIAVSPPFKSTDEPVVISDAEDLRVVVTPNSRPAASVDTPVADTPRTARRPRVSRVDISRALER